MLCCARCSSYDFHCIKRSNKKIDKFGLYDTFQASCYRKMVRWRYWFKGRCSRFTTTDRVRAFSFTVPRIRAKYLLQCWNSRYREFLKNIRRVPYEIKRYSADFRVLNYFYLYSNIVHNDFHKRTPLPENCSFDRFEFLWLCLTNDTKYRKYVIPVKSYESHNYCARL